MHKNSIPDVFLKLLIIFYIVNAFSLLLQAQISIVPVPFFITNRETSGSFTLINNSDIRQEIRIEKQFGYWTSDSSKEVTIKYDDSSRIEYSAAEWVSFFPPKTILLPKDRKTIRYIAKPPSILKDGEYWTQVHISNREVETEDTTKPRENAIRLKLQSITSQTNTLFFRKGEVRTGISISNVGHKNMGNKLVFYLTLNREGNAAYLGNLIINLKDQNNKIIKKYESKIAIFFTSSLKVEFDEKDLNSGMYVAEIEVNTNREQKNNILKSDPVFINESFEIK